MIMIDRGSDATYSVSTYILPVIEAETQDEDEPEEEPVYLCGDCGTETDKASSKLILIRACGLASASSMVIRCGIIGPPQPLSQIPFSFSCHRKA